MWAKIITIKRTKDLTYFSLCALIYLIHEFHNLSWIIEINELFHDIPIYLDAPVYAFVLMGKCLCDFKVVHFISLTSEFWFYTNQTKL